MKNLRCFFLPLLIMGAGMYVTACSGDDNEEVKEEEVILDNDPPQDYDGLSVSFQLLNKDSIATKHLNKERTSFSNCPLQIIGILPYPYRLQGLRCS